MANGISHTMSRTPNKFAGSDSQVGSPPGSSDITARKHSVLLAIDPVILSIKDDMLQVLLFDRPNQPFAHKAELPGTLLLSQETAMQALERKLKSLFGTSKFFFQEFGSFTNPDRDPRSRAISLGFVMLVDSARLTIPPTSAWHPVNNLPSLAFDHDQIISCACDYLRKTLRPSSIRHLLPSKFALNHLQRIYELIEQKKHDNRNFRKWALSAQIVKETNDYEENVSHRPAKLYTFTRQVSEDEN